MVLRFQSAPLTDVRGDGRHAGTDRPASDEFQSAPLTDVRGDIQLELSQIFARLFQSAPLTDVRGDSQAIEDPKTYFLVSIRSPH